MIRTKGRMRLCVTLLVCILAFIWGNSLMSAELSQAFSDFVKELLVGIFSVGSRRNGSGLLRKAAHFTEFAALGICLGWLFGMLGKGKVRPFSLGVAAACVDETIQIFVPGRGPGVLDVCIDSCGVAAGMIFLYLGNNYLQKRSAKHSLEDSEMKKFLSVILTLTLLLSLTACGGNTAEETTAPAVSVEGTLEELLNRVIEEQPVEFMGGTIPVDLTDTSEDGLWALKYYTGLDNADRITEAGAFEPMMGSIAFSMVMVRVADAGDKQAVAEAMKSGIDTRKWICVEADDLLVAGYGDVVMLIMVDSNSGMTAQSFVDAFQRVVGAELEFVI